ncbi:hypothetical protein RRG08_017891 [Elysia crispata]|uniref:Metalloendopeptidase n=1 Tax=Elysia crispata TaxID=231223 RepID=A0AAE1CK63_9GAST|nr:hypothetical protein RRG08_017891 [Elysia crispata]
MGRLKFSPDVLENCAILKLSKEPKNLDVKRVTRYEFYVTGKTCKRFQKQKSMNFLKLTVFDKVSECKTTATRRRLSTDLIANTDRCPSCGAHAAESVNSLWKRFCYQESFLWRFYFAVFLLTAMMVNFPSLTSAASVDSLHNSSTSSLSLPSPEMTDATSQLFNDQDKSSTVLFEGDIILSPADKEHLLSSLKIRRKRKTVADKSRIWPLPIPYRFSNQPQHYLNASERQVILDAVRELSAFTCITFREVDSNYKGKPVLDFMKGYGCWSHVGREQAYPFQEMSVAESCIMKGIILHELGHVIGFWHEQSRPDRDNYVTFVQKNVNRRESYNFKMETWGDIDNFGIPYDVGSIMHYGSTSYSKNGKVTLRSKDPLLQRSMGQREGMSFYDIKAANMAYCKDVCSIVTFSCLHDGYPDPKDCSRCRCPDGLHGTRCQAAAPSVGSKCGGPLFVDRGTRYTIQTPGFPNFYSAGIHCNWLFQAQPGMRLYLSVKPESFMQHPKCLTSNVSVCENDFLEVKYSLNFGNTGARFCCGTPPPPVIVSSGNTLLVLFRTSRIGVGGVSADIHAESCGGCFPTLQPQVPCLLAKTVPCVQKWVKQEYVACPVYFRVFTSACNKYVNRKHSRRSICHKEKEQCCAGYQLRDGMCHATEEVILGLGEGGTTGDITGKTSKPQVTPDPMSGWMTWAPWSACSATCGGCGRRGRVRNCSKISMCG